MEEEEKSKVTVRGCLIVGLVIGGGMILVSTLNAGINILLDFIQALMPFVLGGGAIYLIYTAIFKR